MRTEREEESGRIKKKVYPVDWEKLIPEDVKRNLFVKEKDRGAEKAPAAERREPMTITTA